MPVRLHYNDQWSWALRSRAFLGLHCLDRQVHEQPRLLMRPSVSSIFSRSPSITLVGKATTCGVLELNRLSLACALAVLRNRLTPCGQRGPISPATLTVNIVNIPQIAVRYGLCVYQPHGPLQMSAVADGVSASCLDCDTFHMPQRRHARHASGLEFLNGFMQNTSI